MILYKDLIIIKSENYNKTHSYLLILFSCIFYIDKNIFFNSISLLI